MKAVYSPHYSFDLGPHHPFPMAKYRLVFEHLTADGTLAPGDVLTAGPAPPSDLECAHTREYVSRFLQGELTEADQRRLGFPWSPELCRRAVHATGGTLAAARAALSDGMAANLAGGSHHAFADHGEGYCALHDMAVAIRVLQQDRPSLRIAVIDCDVHQGNGSAAILGADPRVFTFSIHCESNYPLRKIAGSRDVGLADGTGDEEYLQVLAVELDELWSRFRPELVFYQAGVDPLGGDRLGRLRLTREGLHRRDEQVLRRCLESQVPAVVVLGGGYARRTDETVAAHAATIRVARRVLDGTSDPPAGRSRTRPQADARLPGCAAEPHHPS